MKRTILMMSITAVAAFMASAAGDGTAGKKFVAKGAAVAYVRTIRP